MTGPNLLRALIRFARRQEAAARLAGRMCAECREAALHGPPLTAQERRRHHEAVTAVRVADEAKRQQQ